MVSKLLYDFVGAVECCVTNKIRYVDEDLDELVILMMYFFCLAELDKKDVKPNLYSYTELKIATQDFHPTNVLGKGGFGVVFKVHLHF